MRLFTGPPVSGGRISDNSALGRRGDFCGNPAAAMTKSMLYTMPIMMGVFAINMPAGLGLYWTISNLFGILQQVILSKHYKKKFAEEAAQ